MTAHDHKHGQWTHDHVFLGQGHEKAETRTRLVVYLTASFMVVEIVCGILFGSMALLADGVHMATHVGALGLAAGAYWLARRHAKNPRFTFGSGKFGDLAAFTSALTLGFVAFGVAGESLFRLYAPVAIRYGEAIPIAIVGLLVNLASAYLLHDAHEHHHEDEHDHDDHEHHHDHAHDHNLRAAYVHVIADAATSVLAIVALIAGAFFGAGFLDPVVGLLGAFVISRWSYQLLRDSALVLVDAEDNPDMAGDLRSTLEKELNLRVADLHLWRLGPGHRGLIVSLIAPDDTSPEEIKREIGQRYAGLSHVTVEVTVCSDCARTD